MLHHRFIFSSTTKEGVFGYVSRRESLALGAVTPGVKASRRAFTLIELLVVIAIIAILAAMLLPVLNQAKVRGQTAYEINNFKQLQLCWHMYVADNNDYLPPNFVSGGGAKSNSWVVGNVQTDYTAANIQAGILFPYNQQPKIYQCPANTKTIQVTGLPPPGSGVKPNQIVPQTRTCSIEISLGGNFPAEVPAGPWTITYNGNPTFKSYQKFSQIQTTRIASKIVFADEAQATLDDGTFGLYPRESPVINTWWNIPGNRHGRGTVWSFADGHCEFWKWHGSIVNTVLYQTTYGEENISGDSSDDLARTQAAGAQYP
jgi:prepilin-type N-terminal cleavage/methylation domain-containing protein/prepilin-type processing-associated H-X9-DG protein